MYAGACLKELRVSRKPWIAAVIALLLLAAAFIWRFWGGSNESPSNPADSISVQDSPLTINQQTRVRMPTGEDQSGDSANSEKTETDANAAASSGKYDFKNAEEALAAYSNLVAQHFDMLKQDPNYTPPPPFHSYDDSYVSWEDNWYAGIATSLTLDKVYEHNEYPELRKAISPFINEWEDWSPPNFMVKAGRWPSAVLRDDIVLPNGEILDLNTMKNKRVVIKFRKLMVLDEVGQLAMKEYENREAEIVSRLASASDNESAALLDELDYIRETLKTARTPEYGEIVRGYFVGDIDPDEAEEVVIDLGIIEKDLSQKDLGD